MTNSPQTDKGTVIRQAFYKLFEKEIEEVYSRSELSSSTNAPSSEPEIRAFLKEEICTLDSQAELDDDTDLFSVGLDSLQALQLRSCILKKLPISGKALAMNFVFDFPSVNALTEELVSLQHGQTSKSIPPVQEQMGQLIEKYGSFQHHVPKPNSNEGQYIVSYISETLLPSFNSNLGSDRCNWIIRSTRNSSNGSPTRSQANTLPCSCQNGKRRYHARYIVDEHPRVLSSTTPRSTKKNCCASIRLFKRGPRTWLVSICRNFTKCYMLGPLRLVRELQS